VSQTTRGRGTSVRKGTEGIKGNIDVQRGYIRCAPPSGLGREQTDLKDDKRVRKDGTGRVIPFFIIERNNTHQRWRIAKRGNKEHGKPSGEGEKKQNSTIERKLLLLGIIPRIVRGKGKRG